MMLLQLSSDKKTDNQFNESNTDKMEYQMRESFVNNAQSLIQKNLQPKNYAYSNINERKSKSKRINLSFEALNQ